MKNSARTVVDKMFSAFAAGNVDNILDTVSDDTVWIYHGTQVIPKGEYKGRDGARKFFTGILNGTEIIEFRPEQFIVDGNMVVVLGNEHQKVKRSGKELKQKWVQIYTVENDLISRMEEFATSEVVNR
jgi:ketosteroid isomerase-like protein